MTVSQIERVALSADVLWNLCGHLRQPLLGMFRRRAFVDLDPGHIQLAAVHVDVGFDDHEAFLTVGLYLRRPGNEAPLHGKDSVPFLPFVHLPAWQRLRSRS